MKFEKNLHQMYDNFYNFNWKDKSAYCNYLAQSFFYISHSTRLLAAAASRCKLSEQNLFKRMVKHVGEEANHELLCVKDLKNLGKNISDYTEYSSTKALYQTQYFGIEHYSPTYLLGYIYTLETAACIVGPKIINDQLKGTYDKSSCSFLQVHANEDLDHVEEAKKTISSLSDSERDMVTENIAFTCDLFSGMLTEIMSRS